MGSLQRILGDLRKGGEGEDALRDFVELEARAALLLCGCGIETSGSQLSVEHEPKEHCGRCIKL